MLIVQLRRNFARLLHRKEAEQVLKKTSTHISKRMFIFVVIFLLCLIFYSIHNYNIWAYFALHPKHSIHLDNNSHFETHSQIRLTDVELEIKGHNLSGKREHKVNQNGSDNPLDYFLKNRNVEDVNCRFIINGNKTEISSASERAKLHPRANPIGPLDYVKKTSDCNQFITERGYLMSSLTKLEEEFPIAFSILMYKDIEQVERLLRAIYRPQNIYCIHVDLKTDNDTYRAMEGIAKCFDNVFMPDRRINVIWAQYPVLEADLLCMEALLQRNKKWKYFINLTGQEFPLRTNYELVRILMTYNGANDIEGTVKRSLPWRWEFLPPPPHHLTAFKGEVHIVANRDYVEFALHNPKAKDLLNWVKKVKIPDECFFATLNHNPSLGVRGAYLGYPETDTTTRKPYLARFKNWTKDKSNSIRSWPCNGKPVRNVCHFGAGDLPLLSTRRELFANKFDWNYERYARDCLEELHFNITRDEYLGKASFDTSNYQKLGFVKDKIE